jgi:hypothetical protein
MNESNWESRIGRARKDANKMTAEELGIIGVSEKGRAWFLAQMDALDAVMEERCLTQQPTVKNYAY